MTDTRYFVDGQGNYLGGFGGAAPPTGAIEIPAPPDDARQVWNGSTWSAAPAQVAALDVDTLAAALVAKGVLADADIAAAVASARRVDAQAS